MEDNHHLMFYIAQEVDKISIFFGTNPIPDLFQIIPFTEANRYRGFPMVPVLLINQN